jgi:hypothetical protein
MKIKDSLLKQKVKTFKIDFTYEKWLNDFISNPTSQQIDQMEKQSLTNNPNYQPLKGA